MRYIKHLLSLLVICSMMTFGQVLVSLGNVTAVPGDSVTVPMNVQNFNGAGSFTIMIRYDTTVLKWGQPLNWNSQLTAGQPLAGYNNNNRTLTLSWADLTARTIATGKLVDLQFKYIGGSSNITFATSGTPICEITDVNGDPLTANYTNGSVSLGSLPPAVPILAAPLNNATGQATSLNLTWNAVSSAASYRVQLAADAAFNTLIVNDSTVTGTTKAVGSLANNTIYYWRVNAKSSGGTSAYSSVYNFTTIVAIPAGQVLVSLGNVTAAPGDSVTIPMNVQNFNGAGSFTIMIRYDTTVLKWGQPLNWNSQLTAGQPLAGYNNNNRTLTLSWADLTARTIATGKLVDLQFKYIGGSSNITFATSGSPVCEITDVNGDPLAASYTNGSVSLGSFPPAVPILATPLNNATGQPTSLNLTWNAVSGADSFRVQVSTDALFGSFVVNDSAKGTSKSVSSLLNNTKYYWRVSAKNAAGTSDYSPVNNFTTIVAVPILATPANNATGQPTSLNLTWNAVSGADSFRVQVSTDTLFGSFVLNDSARGTSKLVGSLANNTKYYWRVSAKNAAGTSDYSPVNNFTTIVAAPTLATPASGSTGQPTSLNLTWNTVAGADSFRVQVSKNELFDTLIVNDSARGTSKLVGPLLNKTKYYWRVSAKNAAGTSAYSTVYNFTTIVALPAVPTLAAPANNAKGQLTSLTLKWNKVVDAESFHVQLSKDSSFSTIVKDSSIVTSDTLAVSSLLNNTKYYWRVSAKNVAGTSAYSLVYNFTTEISTGVNDKMKRPDKYEMAQNFPNPFNPSTIIRFGLPENATVRLIIYNQIGEQVAELVNGQMEAGYHDVLWSAANMSSGVYFYEIKTEKFRSVKKLIIMK